MRAARRFIAFDPDAELLHELPRLCELLEQPVDVLDRAAAAARDALAAAAVDHGGIAPLLRRHRVDDRDRAAHLLLAAVDVDALQRPAHARDHRDHLLERAHLAHLLELVAEVLERELLAPELAHELLRLLPLDVLLGERDQAEHVAEPEDAADHARGVERLEGLDLLADAGELDGLAGHRRGRQRGAAARVAVELGQHDAGDADPLVELVRAAHRVLAGERVGDVEHLGRLRDRLAARRARPSARRRCAGARRCRR